jgi:hypothetical protein
MTGKIFINYRRGDDAGFTQALYQRLEADFAPSDLFMDVEGKIGPGDDFVEVLSAQVDAADILLVVIGPRWADLLVARKDDPDDFVVIEIKAALDRGKRVIPVLVGGAAMPRAEALPPSIRALSRRNAMGLRPERFRADCQGLVSALKGSLAASEQERASSTGAERKAAETARLLAEVRAATRAGLIEEKGRAQTAAGLPPEEVRKAEESANWSFVQERGDIQDVRDHLARFPGGVTEEQALDELDDRVWLSLHPHPTIEGLRAYLGEFPNGAFAEDARARIAEMELIGLHGETAAVLEPLETLEWELVSSTNDIGKIEEFVKSRPDGPHAEAAKIRIKELRALSSPTPSIRKSPWLHTAMLILSIWLIELVVRRLEGPFAQAAWALSVLAIYAVALWIAVRWWR